MYALRTVFRVESIEDIDILNKIYENINGGLEIIGTDIKIEWSKSPFFNLIKLIETLKLNYSSNI